MTKIIIAGGGIAGLEALVALRRHLGTDVRIDLLEANLDLVERPITVLEPFDGVAPRHFDLAQIAADHDAVLCPDQLASVWPAAQRLTTVRGDLRQYDALLVAVGARPVPAVAGALTFSGRHGVSAMRALLADLVAGRVRSVAFAAPVGVTWTLPLYELALMTAERLRAARVEGVRLALVTPEDNPLDVFGTRQAARIRALLARRGIGMWTGAVPMRVGPGVLEVAGAAPIAVERVVALPRLGGPTIAGLPHDAAGFIPTDRHSAVPGAPGVWAAGDATTLPVKQGALAALQADAAADAIAARLGVDIVPEPFRPVLRGVLLDPRGPQLLDGDTAAVPHAAEPPDAPMWWPPAKVAARHLAPYLAAARGIHRATRQ
jgi:sulfide:quinone oxidoreductase